MLTAAFVFWTISELILTIIFRKIINQVVEAVNNDELGHRKIRFYTTRDELLNVVGAAVCMGLFYGGPFVSFWICLQIFWSPLYPLLFVYLIWMHVDKNTPHRDGRRLQWVCSSWIYRRFRQYFPHTIVKTVDIPDDKNYIFCLFPHGIAVTAGFAHFLTNCTDFSKLFPGIKTTFHTLNSNFLYPFLREYSLFSGLLAVSKEALLHQLNKTRSGRAVVIVPGGSAEAMISQPGTQRIILKNRKGFIKLAITTGFLEINQKLKNFSSADVRIWRDRPVRPPDLPAGLRRLQNSRIHKEDSGVRSGGAFYKRRWILPRPFWFASSPSTSHDCRR